MIPIIMSIQTTEIFSVCNYPKNIFREEAAIVSKRKNLYIKMVERRRIYSEAHVFSRNIFET